MKTIKVIDAIRLAKEISKIPDGRFTIGFFPYNRTTGKASAKLRTIEGCKVRAQLSRERFSIDGDNFFLFEDSDGNPKTCYQALIRFMGFPDDNYQPRKVIFHGDTN
ncbi:hypothetical protein [Plebeiibacterium sediminum]|uniref:Uncharacterized protein n=1 Tax=Plebeiibacterium sediminum TaxID=2992112 RepID=A0AAE3M139_9BACT|nr:hypothetical protein [Plebeiobacterium sediminum]MCW3784926.1 hypothetical protein [Plebeiobacterium sediminum]